MFRNGPEVDGGGTAYLGPTTVIEMTIPMSQSSSNATLDDSWVLAGPIKYHPQYNQNKNYFILKKKTKKQNNLFKSCVQEK